MTALATIACDTDGCFQRLEHADNGFAILRIIARGLGWKHHNGKDYCNMHAPDESDAIDKSASRSSHILPIREEV